MALDNLTNPLNFSSISRHIALFKQATVNLKGGKV